MEGLTVEVASLKQQLDCAGEAAVTKYLEHFMKRHNMTVLVCIRGELNTMKSLR